MQGLIYKKTNQPSNQYQPPLTLSTKCFVYSVTLHRPYIARTVTSPTLLRLSWARSKVLRREVGQKPGTDLSGITLRQSMYVCMYSTLVQREQENGVYTLRAVISQNCLEFIEVGKALKFSVWHPPVANAQAPPYAHLSLLP